MRRPFLAYVDGKSFLHKLDPRTKIITLMILSIVIFHSYHLLILLSLFILFIAAVLLARVPFKKLFVSLRPMMFFIGLVFLLHFLFMTAPAFDDVTIVIEIADERLNVMMEENDWGAPGGVAGTGAHYMTRVMTVEPEPIKPIKNSDFTMTPSFFSFITGLGTAMRFVLLLLFASLMSATTKQSAIIQGIERMVRPLPLKWANMTSRDLTLMVFLTIRFIPLLASTGSQITDSARSRAFRMRKHPIKSIQIISVGLVNSIVSFADDVSMAMQNRGYTGVGWTSMNELKFKKRDALFFCVFIFIIGAIVAAVGHQYAMMASGFAAMASSVMVMALV